ncbi:hypothetical protein GOBAR_DD34256 [Gossypium barbadense]|nr:hypothetical protein GOBAR_DD34256 [Gossypium barbadense]
MEDVEAVLKILMNFTKASGHNINIEKSMIMFSPNTPLPNDNIIVFYLVCVWVNSWSKRLLSYGGKEIFVKAILQSLPTYASSIFLAPKGILEDMQSKMSRMWWTSNERSRGWSMLAWDRVCHPKARDSNGFIIGGSGGFKEKVMPAEWVELEAFEESLKVENRFNILKAVFELDYASLVNRVNNQGKDITVLGNSINEVCKQLEKFDSVKIAWAN